MLQTHNPRSLTLSLPTAAYLHIPFCRRRCYYCDFPVAIVGDRATGNSSHTIARYVEVLCQEIRQAPTARESLQTVFFGGGTPSLLSIDQMARILQTLEQQVGIAATAEISIEIDPGTFDLQQLQGYLDLGVNRFSLGVQAFQSELLSLCGRTHSLPEIDAAIAMLHQTGIKNFSLDLISGLPHQTVEQWQQSLEQAIAIAPTHLSCYDLIVEPDTAFGRQYQPGIAPLPADTTAAQMYRLAQQLLTAAGYEHYEISNYARPGYQCRHNRVYWENRPFYGFGMGAASYLQGQRFTRPRKTRESYQWVEEGCLISQESVVSLDLLLETLMLNLRLAEGLHVRRLAEKFGQETIQKVWNCLQPYYDCGWILVEPAFSRQIDAIARIRLSDPEGFLFSNTILADLFTQLDSE